MLVFFHCAQIEIIFRSNSPSPTETKLVVAIVYNYLAIMCFSLYTYCNVVRSYVRQYMRTLTTRRTVYYKFNNGR